MMKTFKVKCKIITPLFMGGANQQPELRTQSINGVLRWWFRVLGGSIEDEKDSLLIAKNKLEFSVEPKTSLSKFLNSSTSKKLDL